MSNSPGSRRFLPGRRRRSLVAVVVVVFLLLATMSALSGFWPDLRWVNRRGTVDLVEAESRPLDRLRVGVDTCHGDPEVVVFRETDIDVQIKVKATRWPFRGSDDCQAGVVAQLQQPLGDRAVVDQRTGRSINVRRGKSLIEGELRSPDRLRVIVNSCNRDPQLVLRRETDTEVHVMVVDSDSPSDTGEFCRETVEFNLREPLGDRIVIDAHSNQPVNVNTVD
jgi:hypothetical protein